MGLRVLNADTAAGTAHSNSTDEAVLASYSFPANFWKAGKVVKFEGLAVVSAQNSTDTVQLRVRFGGTTLTGTAIMTNTAVDAAVSDICLVSGTITCRTVGSSGTLYSLCMGSNSDAAGISVDAYSASLTSQDTTAALLLELTADWSVASASNSIASQMWNVYEVTD